MMLRTRRIAGSRGDSSTAAPPRPGTQAAGLSPTTDDRAGAVARRAGPARGRPAPPPRAPDGARRGGGAAPPPPPRRLPRPHPGQPEPPRHDLELLAERLPGLGGGARFEVHRGD